MKKIHSFIYKVFAILMLGLFIMQPVSAQKIAEAVIENTQDYLILATVSDITDNYISVEYFDSVKKFDPTPSNETASDDKKPKLPDSIKIQKFRYSYCSEHADVYNTPKIGDNIFAAIKKDSDIYRISACVYKIDTVDIKTLNFLVPETMKNKACMDDVAALSYFVASNGAEKKFKFSDDTVSIVRNNETFVIYPDSNKSLPIKYIDSNGKVIDDSEKSEDVITMNPGQPSTHNRFAWNFTGENQQQSYVWLVSAAIIIFGIALGILLVHISRRKKFKNKRQG